MVELSAHTRPVDALVAAGGVRDERLLAAIAAVPRSAFVPAEYAGQAELDDESAVSRSTVHPATDAP